MKNTDLLQLANALYIQLDPEEKQNADLAKEGKYMGHTVDGKLKPSLTLLERSEPKLNIYDSIGANIGELIRATQAEIKAEEVKKSGRGDISTVLRKIIKRTSRENLQCSYINNGKQYIADGIIGFILTEIQTDIPYKEEVFPISSMENNIKETINNASEILETPDLGKLKAYIKIKKAEARSQGYSKDGLRNYPLYSWGKIACNAEKLVEVLTVIPNAKLYFVGELHPIGILGKNGDKGILCPVNIKKIPEEQKRKTAL